MSWETVTLNRRWRRATDDGGRHLVVLVGTEMRHYEEEAGRGPQVHVYEPDCADCWREPDAAEPIVAPLAEMTWVATYEVPAQFAPWVRALDDTEIVDYLEGGQYR